MTHGEPVSFRDLKPGLGSSRTWVFLKTRYESRSSSFYSDSFVWFRILYVNEQGREVLMQAGEELFVKSAEQFDCCGYKANVVGPID